MTSLCVKLVYFCIVVKKFKVSKKNMLYFVMYFQTECQQLAFRIGRAVKKWAILCFGTMSISTTAFRHQTTSTFAFWHLFISTIVRLAPFKKCLRPQLFLICSPNKNSIINLQLITPILMGDVTNFKNVSNRNSAEVCCQSKIL